LVAGLWICFLSCENLRLQQVCSFHPVILSPTVMKQVNLS